MTGLDPHSKIFFKIKFFIYILKPVDVICSVVSNFRVIPGRIFNKPCLHTDDICFQQSFYIHFNSNNLPKITIVTLFIILLVDGLP